MNRRLERERRQACKLGTTTTKGRLLCQRQRSLSPGRSIRTTQSVCPRLKVVLPNHREPGAHSRTVPSAAAGWFHGTAPPNPARSPHTRRAPLPPAGPPREAPPSSGTAPGKRGRARAPGTGLEPPPPPGRAQGKPRAAAPAAGPRGLPRSAPRLGGPAAPRSRGALLPPGGRSVPPGPVRQRGGLQAGAGPSLPPDSPQTWAGKIRTESHTCKVSMALKHQYLNL